MGLTVKQKEGEIYLKGLPGSLHKTETCGETLAEQWALKVTPLHLHPQRQIILLPLRQHCRGKAEQNIGLDVRDERYTG